MAKIFIYSVTCPKINALLLVKLTHFHKCSVISRQCKDTTRNTALTTHHAIQHASLSTHHTSRNTTRITQHAPPSTLFSTKQKTHHSTHHTALSLHSTKHKTHNSTHHVQQAPHSTTTQHSLYTAQNTTRTTARTTYSRHHTALYTAETQNAPQHSSLSTAQCESQSPFRVSPPERDGIRARGIKPAIVQPSDMSANGRCHGRSVSLPDNVSGFGQ